VKSVRGSALGRILLSLHIKNKAAFNDQEQDELVEVRRDPLASLHRLALDVRLRFSPRFSVPVTAADQVLGVRTKPGRRAPRFPPFWVPRLVDALLFSVGNSTGRMCVHLRAGGAHVAVPRCTFRPTAPASLRRPT
jgi:hypothetical protein